jgi:hypothetical protein
MFRKLLFLAALAPSLWLPSRLIAGGPPFLCLPIEGVTPDNATAGAALIDAKLENQRWSHPEWSGGVAIHQQPKQPYMTFYMKEEVRLSDIDAALKGSDFSIPRDRLKLFGHVILEIDPRTTPAKDLLAALDSMEYVSIADSEESKGGLLVTVEMPYPAVENRPNPVTVWSEKFVKNDYTSVQSTKPELPIGAQALPSYNAFRDVLATHNANLTGIRWSTAHACRALGCVSVPKADAVLATATELSSPQKN